MRILLYASKFTTPLLLSIFILGSMTPQMSLQVILLRQMLGFSRVYLINVLNNS